MQQLDLRALSLTERQLSQDEHARLERFLRELREACSEFNSLEECQDCSREKIASCQGRLISFTHDFLDFVIGHFENEEKIMSEIYSTQQSNRNFQLHQQEHMKLVREMESLMHELSVMSRRGHTASAIREFYYRVAEIFNKHAHTFDEPLMQLPEPQN